MFTDCNSLWDVLVCLLTVTGSEMYWYVYWLWQAVDELIDKGILDGDPMEIARFLHTTKRLWACKKREFLERRWSIVSCCKGNIFSVCLNLYCSYSLVDLLWPVITKGLQRKTISVNDMCSTPALQLKVLNNATEQECACALGVLSAHPVHMCIGLQWLPVKDCIYNKVVHCCIPFSDRTSSRGWFIFRTSRTSFCLTPCVSFSARCLHLTPGGTTCQLWWMVSLNASVHAIPNLALPRVSNCAVCSLVLSLGPCSYRFMQSQTLP